MALEPDLGAGVLAGSLVSVDSMAPGGSGSWEWYRKLKGGAWS